MNCNELHFSITGLLLGLPSRKPRGLTDIYNNSMWNMSVLCQKPLLPGAFTICGYIFLDDVSLFLLRLKTVLNTCAINSKGWKSIFTNSLSRAFPTKLCGLFFNSIRSWEFSTIFLLHARGCILCISQRNGSIRQVFLTKITNISKPTLQIFGATCSRRNQVRNHGVR